MYWALWTGFCIGKCIAGWLAAGCWLLAAFVSFSFSFHFISFHISYLLSCSGDEMDQYLKVDQWQDHAAFGIEIDQHLRFQKG